MKTEVKQETVKEEVENLDATPMIATATPQSNVCITHSGKVSRPPDRLIESAYAFCKKNSMLINSKRCRHYHADRSHSIAPKIRRKRV